MNNFIFLPSLFCVEIKKQKSYLLLKMVRFYKKVMHFLTLVKEVNNRNFSVTFFCITYIRFFIYYIFSSFIHFFLSFLCFCLSLFIFFFLLFFFFSLFFVIFFLSFYYDFYLFFFSSFHSGVEWNIKIWGNVSRTPTHKQESHWKWRHSLYLLSPRGAWL